MTSPGDDEARRPIWPRDKVIAERTDATTAIAVRASRACSSLEQLILPLNDLVLLDLLGRLQERLADRLPERPSGRRHNGGDG